ncbi:FecR family protein [Rufibacter quisquiliarum]|uniref:Ferric-dicitrate binding protein FerR (Iron transport regulator) n=1 Tax=Rufibacter quisquiliarum TaxID=1549639 RepID=A0A839GV03_9BACT|nr:FecR family protein [Rufibacter quisquiliarum]MBA9078707.1 ferric-dicitrate binding protein FerR (iron transport regulator) [Rufibacter quisquiliarum]
MTREEYLHLYQKNLNGSCTPEEMQQLEEHQDEFELEELPWNDQQMGAQHDVKHALLARLQEDMARQQSEKRPGFAFSYSVAAAVAVLLLSTGVFFWLNRGEATPPQALVQKSAPEAEVTPGRDRAYLTLADGTVVDLDETQNGNVTQQGAVKIIKVNGRLSYQGPNNGQQLALYNTLSTPRGGQYQITLSDGTKVWLNATSSLRFPAAFAGKERVVQLQGEAYFEVAKNKHMPFKVVASEMEVEVLGTHFNLMAYEDEDRLRTSLLEGSVRVSSTQKQVVLQPNQEAVLQKNSHALQVHQVDASESIAWKNGQFLFHEEDLKSVMRKIARWYDVDVVYQSEIGEKSFTGTISRFEKIEDVLEMLELTGTVHFEQKGRRLYVKA